ncbi:DUF305 domain-containing protein [Chelatococcus sp. SYSU_G07232]|uniref:DUF305 domain-containing protein n=2 Tax=Chelatococcus albus TaxID=3047466 RepID=A0ABT7AN77_9HYPH|nr:DUF305 domain-containing protein [Chelatococcus sp. SYSU_G07232]MDJ1160016.1 DUF305 domain-containing protein [Chelatococcus sp. SYSU_G07232]
MPGQMPGQATPGAHDQGRAGSAAPGRDMPGQGMMGPGMMGHGMMGPGMMGMMRGGMMGGRMTGGMPGLPGGGDESVPSLALRAVGARMHRDMAFAYTGDVDADFVRNMIAHHQGAIDMATVAIAFGKDAEIRKLAEAIVKAQQAEIATMRDWLARKAPR